MTGQTDENFRDNRCCRRHFSFLWQCFRIFPDISPSGLGHHIAWWLDNEAGRRKIRASHPVAIKQRLSELLIHIKTVFAESAVKEMKSRVALIGENFLFLELQKEKHSFRTCRAFLMLRVLNPGRKTT